MPDALLPLPPGATALPTARAGLLPLPKGAVALDETKPSPKSTAPVSPRAEALRETIVGPGISSREAFSAQQKIEQDLREQGKTDTEIQSDPNWQQAAKATSRAVSAEGTAMATMGGTELVAGEIVPLVASRIGQAAKETISPVLPGATRRAEEALAKIAVPTGKFDPLGQQILKETVGGEYSTLYDQRASLLGRAAHIADEDERRKAFREIYQSPDFAALRKFEQTPLGKKLTATTGRYSEVVKADPAKIPDMVFDTPQSVRDFRQLLGGDQTRVEEFARRYAAEAINKRLPEKGFEFRLFQSQASQASRAVDAWLKDPKQEWLDEVPETKAAAEQFAQGLRDAAKAQQIFRFGVLGLGAGTLFEEGFHPWSWLRSGLGL